MIIIYLTHVAFFYLLLLCLFPSLVPVYFVTGVWATYSQYIYSIILFVVTTRDLYKSNQEIHRLSTRHNTNLHIPTSRLTVFQKGPYYSGIRVYNHLPSCIKSMSNEMKRFKPMLKRLLLSNSFYSLDEYFNCEFN
jgi:hypothetical protein